ncbi:hypothetical protein T459_12046 [Capsicum annuum]|uniref:RNase III domain-containing protein n=1 Tax=Capsicum annuum TaxID=4072 RepID=A0A2G2ZNQ2_CAPAN|nr:hypothetical protein T459_12046 [Capsicum annuum]
MWNSKRLESNLSSCLDSISGSTTLIRYTFDEIKAVTKNFSWVNIVETGWFGNLYKGLEVMTTKKFLKKFHLESLEKLGDSFLKYAVSIQLFKTYENHHERLLSLKKNKFISNVVLLLTTDLRSACVKTERYAQSVVKAILHKNILHASQ